MSIKIMQEAWEHAPVDQGTLLVLLALADNADEGSRTCFPGIHETIAPKTRLSPRQVKRCLAELSAAGIIEVRRNASPVRTNLYRIEPVSKWRSAISSPPEPIPEVTFATGRSDTHVTSEVTPMSPEPSVTVSEPSVLCAREQLTLLSESQPPTKIERFDEFWKVYPKKVAKPAARKAWDKAVRKVDPQVIIAAAARYARSDQVERGFAKHPQGWLNDERWTDGDLPPAARSQPFRLGEVVR
jgi:hypothetical protein